MAIKGKRPEIACIQCRNIIKFPEYVGQDYGGDLLCDNCMSLLRIKLSKWEVKEFKVLEDKFKESEGIKKLLAFQELAAKLKGKS